MQKNIAILLLSFAMSLPAVAQQQPLQANIVAPRIPLHLELDKSGFLADMHAWLMEKANIQADVTVLPWVRAMAMFESEKVDGLYPSWMSSTYTAKVLYSDPFMQVDHFIYSKAGAPIFSSLAELNGRRLGLIEHYQLHLDFSGQENLSVHYARNSQALMTLLLSGRVDAIILSNIEVQALQVAMQFEPLSVDTSAVIASKFLCYVLLNNTNGVAIQARINDAIAEAKQSGDLQALIHNAVSQFK